MTRDIKLVLNQLAGAAIGDIAIDDLYEMQDTIDQQLAHPTRKKMNSMTRRDKVELDDSEVAIEPWEFEYSIGDDDDYDYSGNDDEYEDMVGESVDELPALQFSDSALDALGYSDELECIDSSAEEMFDDLADIDGDIVISLDDGSEVYVTQEELERILDTDDEDAFEVALISIENFVQYIATLDMVSEAKSSKNLRRVGRMKIVNRIRGGKLQRRIKKSAVKGFRISGGVVKKMDPREVRKRKIGARIGKRKRKAKMAVAKRKRKISNRIRSQRLKD